MNRASLAGVAAVLLFVLAAGCNAVATPRSAADEARAAAAAQFTKRYAHSRFAQWQVRARPAGADCTVLLIETGVLMDNAMVETVQYGAGYSEVYDGGAQRFSRDKAFRGVAYRDSGDRIWSYGSVSDEEAKTIEPCR
jgi:hypothetical protein